ncbi:MAG: RDD family protein [Clostridiales bacterium]|jgi:uncharacterized RDD family membrane protein YckC|nr:RDD family protein [Clostridiales bacterium]
MNYITIVTPDNVEIEYRLAGAGSRLAAASVDVLVQAAAIFAIAASLFASILNFSIERLAILDLSTPAIALAIMLVFIVYFGYSIAFELAFNGRTVGKMVFRLRAIRENGQPMGLAQCIIRNVFKYAIDFMGIGAASIMLSKKSKRIGDMVASTIVIAEASQVSVESIGSIINSPNASLLENLRLDDEECYLLKEYFGRRQEFLDGGLMLHRRIAAFMAKKFHVSEEMMTEAAIAQILSLNLARY